MCQTVSVRPPPTDLRPPSRAPGRVAVLICRGTTDELDVHMRRATTTSHVPSAPRTDAAENWCSRAGHRSIGPAGPDGASERRSGGSAAAADFEHLAAH